MRLPDLTRVLTLAAFVALGAPAYAMNHLDVDGSVADPATSVVNNPPSTLTMTQTTTAYGTNTYIAPVSGSLPTFTLLAPGSALVPRVRLSVNDPTSTSWGGQTVQVDLWSCTPVMANADRGAWSVTTGAGSGGPFGGGCHLASYTCVMSAVYGDGAYAECGVTVGNVAAPRVSTGPNAGPVTWTLDAITGSGVTGAGKVWTMQPEAVQ